MKPGIRSLDLPDGQTSALLVYPVQPEAGRPVVLWLPAMGVRADYYQPWAETLHGLGCNVAVGELRGVGRSSVRASRRNDFGYADMLKSEIPAMLDAVASAFPGSPVVLGGHSLGGHLSALTLALHPEAGRGLLLVASGTPYYRVWPRRDGMILMVFAALIRLLTEVRGHLPGHRVRFAGREARRIIREWHTLVVRGRFCLRGIDPDIENRMAQVKQPTLAISFTDDPFCPRRAAEHLTGKLPMSPTTHHHLSPEALGVPALDHFRWVRHGHVLVPRIKAWLGSVMSS